MDTDQLYSIGQMAKVCKLSIQTLRYYDNIDLIKPAVIKDNGYRYYNQEQILVFNVIKGLKELKLSLNQIKEVIQTGDIAIVLTIFKEQQQELTRQIRLLESARKNVNNLIENIQLHDRLGEEHYIELKVILPQTVAFTRYHSPSNQVSYIKRFNQLHNIVEENKWTITGSMMAIFHDHYTEFDYNNADIEVCIPISKTERNYPNIKELPEGKFLTKFHKGPYATLVESYKIMLDWCRENKYRMIGPAREIYLVDFLSTKEPENFITELQLPVKQA